MKYVLIELQTLEGGQVANIVTSYDALPQAESAYYSVLAAAAISTIPVHAAVLMTSTGKLLEAHRYDRTGD